MIPCICNIDTLNICMKEFNSKHLKMTAIRTKAVISASGYSGYSCAAIIHILADQLLTQLLVVVGGGGKLILCLHIIGTLDICMKKFLLKNIFLQNGNFVN